jgi:hypothetical protein
VVSLYPLWAFILPLLTGVLVSVTILQVTLFLCHSVNICEGPTVCQTWAPEGFSSEQNRPNNLPYGDKEHKGNSSVNK